MTPMKMALTNKQETITKKKRGRSDVYLYDSLGYTVYYNGRINYYTKSLSVILGSDGSMSVESSTQPIDNFYIDYAGTRYAV